VPNGKRDIIICHTAAEGGKQSALCGYVVLNNMGTETGPFRDTVLKLMVSPTKRRLGIAKSLMQELEAIAARRS